MRIGIISTVGDYSWAGSEEMWKLLATEALRCGHSVAAMLQTPIAQSDELAEFRALGGVVFAYNPLNRYTSRTVSRGLYSRFRRLKRWNPDIVCTLRPSSHPVSRPRPLQAFKSTHRRQRVHHTRQRGVVYQRPSRTRGVASALSLGAANHLRLA